MDIALLVVFAAIGWYAVDHLRAKELARGAGRAACERAGVQFLDDTVAQRRMWLQRNAQGALTLWRVYGFEFASDGRSRYHGRVVLAGRDVRAVELDPYHI